MTNESRIKYQSNHVYPPGETLGEMLEERKMSFSELSQKTGVSRKAINDFIDGNRKLSFEMALQFEHVFGTPVHVWLNLESSYREFLSKPQLGD